MKARYFFAIILTAAGIFGVGTAAYAALNSAPLEMLQGPSHAEAEKDATVDDGAWTDELIKEYKNKAKVTRADAEKVALELYPTGKIVEAWLGIDDNGTLVWDIVVQNPDGAEKWVTVNAVNSKVLENTDLDRLSPEEIMPFTKNN